MELKFNVRGKERKSLVAAISEILNQPTEYAGVPSCKYTVGGYEIDRNGTVTGEYNLGLMVALEERGYEVKKSETFHLITPRGTLLIQERFDTEEQARQAGYGMYFTHKGRDIYTKRGESEHSTIFAMVGDMFEAIDEPETAPNATEAAETGRLAIEYPLEGFTPESRINLERLVESKDILIKQALGIDELPIEETEYSLRFPWFPLTGTPCADSDGDTVNAYAQFISALCNTAKNKKRVVAKPQNSFENPRFSMRIWLISLGLSGKEFDLCRKLLMCGLSGNSGHRHGSPNKATSARRGGIHREVISIRLTPDTLAKLNAIAQTYEGLSRNKLIEQMVERFVDAESLAALEEPECTERTEFTPEGE